MKTDKLTDFEKAMLQVIQAAHPVSWMETEQAYRITESFDQTIEALKKSTANATLVGEEAYKLRQYCSCGEALRKIFLSGISSHPTVEAFVQAVKDLKANQNKQP